MLSPEKAQQIRDLRAQGLTYSAIAERVGCNRNTVGNVLNSRCRYKNEFNRVKLPTEQQQQIIDLHKAGKGAREIADIVGCNETTVIRYRRLDAPQAAKYTPQADRWTQIQEMQDRGLDYRAIAKHLNVTIDAIRQVVYNHVGSGADKNFKARVRRDVLSVVGVCRICSADIVIEINNKPSPYEFSLKWSRRYVDCPSCGQCFSADTLVSKAEVERLWWGQLNDDTTEPEIEG